MYRAYKEQIDGVLVVFVSFLTVWALLWVVGLIISWVAEKKLHPSLVG